MAVKLWLMSILPYAAMITVECLDVGLTTLSKAAMSEGMSHFVFVVYSNGLASLILLPFPLFFNRKRAKPLTFSLLCIFFLLALAGITVVQNCVFTGISYSSPTLASSLSNLIPAFTFLLAVIFRMEKLDLSSSWGKIKVMGTLLSILGALVVTLYKGPTLLVSPFQQKAEIPFSISPTILATTDNWVAAVLKEYPTEMNIVAFCCFFGTIQSAAVALVAERDPNAWKLRSNIGLISVFYSALFGSLVTFSVATWCIHTRGPVFVVMFKPVGIAIAAFLGFIFLGDTLHVGSVFGAVIIVTGFYGVMWARSKEEGKAEAKETDRLQSSSSQETQPFLETSNDQHIHHC